MLAELSGGVMVNHIVNWLSPLKERSTIVTGERGCYIVDTLTADLTFYANGAVSTEWEAIRNFRGVSEGDVTRFAIARREPLVVEHERFRDAVAGGHETGIVTIAQGLRTVQVSTAVLESASDRTDGADRMTAPAVSVIIPVYNTMPYLTRCLDSLVEQSLGLDRIQVIAVDDGSTDGSPEVLDSYAERHPEIVPGRAPGQLRWAGRAVQPGTRAGHRPLRLLSRRR